MRVRADDGSSVRDHLEAAAARGNPTAIAALQGPPFPDVLAGLWDQFAVLDRMRGEGMAGLAPVTLEGIQAARQLFRWRLEPHEVESLHLLDLAIRYPDPYEVRPR